MAAGPNAAELDRAISDWRDRLAAASRNVAELSELPEYLALKAAAKSGGSAAEARGLVATVEELWQGVLLLGEALSRAEAARAAATRLWMPFSTAAPMTVSEILEGKSICIRLGEQPVLHRRLLGGAETVAWVSPAELLATMEAAFDSARAGVARLAGAADAEAALRRLLARQVSELQRRQLPNADALAARLAASASPDRLSALAALEALQPEVERAVQAADEAARALAAARAQLQDLQRRETEALQMAARAEACVAGILPAGPADQARELPGWLDRLERKLAAGQLPAFSAGMANWMALAHHVQAGWQTMTEAAGKAIDERDELRGRFGALAAKHTARTTQGDDATLVALAGAAKAALFGGKVELGSARARLGEYEAALAHKHARPV